MGLGVTKERKKEMNENQITIMAAWFVCLFLDVQ